MTETQAARSEIDARPKDSFGTVFLGWWKDAIADRDVAGARATAARLRRAQGPVEVLSERAVHNLLARLGEDDATAKSLARYKKRPDVLALTMQVVAELREHHRHSLARRLGGDDPAMSELRFRRMLSAESDNLAAALRRAVTMADRKCNVPALARDLLWWDESTRVRWCFDYYGSPSPDAASAPTDTPHAGDDD